MEVYRISTLQELEFEIVKFQKTQEGQASDPMKNKSNPQTPLGISKGEPWPKGLSNPSKKIFWASKNQMSGIV